MDAEVPGMAHMVGSINPENRETFGGFKSCSLNQFAAVAVEANATIDTPADVQSAIFRSLSIGCSPPLLIFYAGSLVCNLRTMKMVTHFRHNSLKLDKNQETGIPVRDSQKINDS